MSGGLLAGLLGIFFVLGVFALPVAVVVGAYTGAIDVGFTSAVVSPSNRQLPDSIGLDAEEEPIVATVVKRSQWLPLLFVGFVLIPIGWGIALMVYAWRLRKRPQYVLTNRRLIVENTDATESYELSRVGQIQTGSTVVESLLSLGHATFSIDRGKLVSVGYLSDPETIAARFRSVVEN
ncbi:hypothetical protein [Haloparvum sp. AD34]